MQQHRWNECLKEFLLLSDAPQHEEGSGWPAAYRSFRCAIFLIDDFISQCIEFCAPVQNAIFIPRKSPTIHRVFLVTYYIVIGTDSSVVVVALLLSRQPIATTLIGLGKKHARSKKLICCSYPQISLLLSLGNGCCKWSEPIHIFFYNHPLLRAQPQRAQQARCFQPPACLGRCLKSRAINFNVIMCISYNTSSVKSSLITASYNYNQTDNLKIVL